MTDMPVTYETHQTTTTTSGSSGPIAPRMEYLRSVPGALKIVEIVLDLIVIICSCIVWFGAMGWVRFVAFFSFITTIVYFLLYFLGAVSNIQSRFIQWALVEFVYYVVISVFYLIAFIICAVNGWLHPAVVASAIFTFLATVVYALDTFWIQLREFRSGGTVIVGGSSSSTTTTTVTTTSSSRTVVQDSAAPY